MFVSCKGIKMRGFYLNMSNTIVLLVQLNQFRIGIAG